MQTKEAIRQVIKNTLKDLSPEELKKIKILMEKVAKKKHKKA
jgi:hypothetical protein